MCVCVCFCCSHIFISNKLPIIILICCLYSLALPFVGMLFLIRLIGCLNGHNTATSLFLDILLPLLCIAPCLESIFDIRFLPENLGLDEEKPDLNLDAPREGVHNGEYWVSASAFLLLSCSHLNYSHLY